MNPPPDWPETEDPELRKKYYFAQLLKQFGDIPELRYITVFDLKPKDNITLEQAIALSKAMYRLFPNELEARIQKDPEGFIESQRLIYVEIYGDIPEVHTYLNLVRKYLLGEKVTDAEREEMDAALLHLRQLKEQNENKQDDDN